MKTFLKQAKYYLVAGGVFLALLLLVLLRGIFTKEGEDGSKTDPIPEVEQALKAKVRKAEEDALVARVEARVEADGHRKQLEAAAEIEDGAARRARLAEILRTL